MKRHRWYDPKQYDRYCLEFDETNGEGTFLGIECRGDVRIRSSKITLNEQGDRVFNNEGTFVLANYKDYNRLIDALIQDYNFVQDPPRDHAHKDDWVAEILFTVYQHDDRAQFKFMKWCITWGIHSDLYSGI